MNDERMRGERATLRSPTPDTHTKLNAPTHCTLLVIWTRAPLFYPSRCFFFMSVCPPLVPNPAPKKPTPFFIQNLGPFASKHVCSAPERGAPGAGLKKSAKNKTDQTTNHQPSLSPSRAFSLTRALLHVRLAIRPPPPPCARGRGRRRPRPRRPRRRVAGGRRGAGGPPWTGAAPGRRWWRLQPAAGAWCTFGGWWGRT